MPPSRRAPACAASIPTLCLAALAFVLACERGGAEREPRSDPPPSYAVPEGFQERQLPDLLTQAEQAIEAQNPQQAVDLLVTAASQRTADAQTRFLYGKALLLTGTASPAIWPLQRAAEGKDADSDESFLYAQALVSGGDPLTSRRLLDRLIEESPESERLIRLRARANNAALDHKSAIADLETVVALAPDDLSIRENLVSLLVESKRIEEARAAVAALNARVAELGLPKSDRARYCVSEALFELGNEDIPRSRALFERCLAAYPDEPNAILPWCHFLEQTGELPRAIEILKAEVARPWNEKQTSWTSALASRLVAAGRRSEAEALLLEKAAASSDPGLLFQLADERIEWGDLEGAREAAFRAITLQTGREADAADFDWSKLPTEGRFALGDLLIRTGDQKIITRLIDSLEADPEAPDFEGVYPILLKARLELERGAAKKALALFEESFRFWPSNVAARYLAGRAAMELGEFDQGLSLYRDAFRAEPAGSDAGLVLARLQVAEGHPLSAADTLSTLLGEKKDDPDALLLFAQVTSRMSAFDNAEKTRADLARFPDRVGLAHREAALEIARRTNIADAIAYLEAKADLDDPLQYEALSQWVAFQLQDQLQDQLQASRLEAVTARLDRLVRRGAAHHLLVRARADRLLDDAASALENAERAVGQDPSFVEGWLEVGDLALDARDFERAQKAFAEARAIDAANERAALGLADVALAKNDREAAESLFRKTLVVHPWQTQAALELARIGFERDARSEQTLIWSRWAARFGGELRSEAAELLGRVRLARGEGREAVQALQVAVRDADRKSRPLFLLARAFVADGDPAQALSTAEQAVAHASFPSEQEAAEASALLEQLKKEKRP